MVISHLDPLAIVRELFQAELMQVQDAGDPEIGRDFRQTTNGFLGDRAQRSVSLPPSMALDVILGVFAAHPMNGGDELGVVEIDHDLLDERSHDTLFDAGIGIWV